MAYEVFIYFAMQSAITFRPDDTALIDSLDSIVLDQARRPIDLVNALRGDAYMGIIVAELQLGKRVRYADFKRDSNGRVIFDSSQDQLSKKLYLGPRARVLQAWNEAYRELERTKDPIQLSEQLTKIFDWHSRNGDLTRMHNAIVLPVLDGAGERIVEQAARWQALRALLAVMKYRATKGRYPESLEEVGFREVDRFAEGPFKFKQDRGAVVVYSIGRDRVDHQAQERVEDAQGERIGGDVVARIPRKVAVPERASLAKSREDSR
jgi:hypothetical protein